MEKGLLACSIFLFFSLVAVSQNPVNEQHKPVDYSGKIYITVQQEARFPDGDRALEKYLRENLKTDNLIKNGAQAGTYPVLLRFIVSTDGTISDIIPLTKYGNGIENEAIRLLRAGPGWLPAVRNGIQVNSFKQQQLRIIID